MKQNTATLITILATTIFIQSYKSASINNSGLLRNYEIIKTEYTEHNGMVMKFEEYWEQTISLDSEVTYRYCDTAAYKIARKNRTRKYILLMTMYSEQIVLKTRYGIYNDTIFKLMTTALDTIMNKIVNENSRHKIRYFRHSLGHKYPEKFMKQLQMIKENCLNHIIKPSTWSEFDRTDRLANLDFFSSLCVEKNDFVVDLFKPEFMSADKLLETLEKIVLKVCDEFTNDF